MSRSTYARWSPSPRFREGNRTWTIHMTFPVRGEADEEARCMRDDGYKTKVLPGPNRCGYAVYLDEGYGRYGEG